MPRGAYSEAGRLRRVLVHRPGLGHLGKGRGGGHCMTCPIEREPAF